MEKRFKFRRVNELTGLFVLIALALAIVGVVFSAQSQHWFARKYAFDVLLPEQGTSGLRRGNEVFILGVSVGWVDDIRVDNDGSMKARVKIRRDFQRFVRTDSTAVIKKTLAVAGDSFMEITRGTNAPLSGRNPTIVCLPAEDPFGRMDQMITGLHQELMPLMKKAGVTLDTWSKLGTDLHETQEKLTQLAVRLGNLTKGVEQGKGMAGKLLTDTAMADEAQKLLSQANETMSELQSAVTNLIAVLKTIQRGTARLPEITGALANESKDMEGIVRQTQTTMRELERSAEALQRHWLFRRYVNKTNPPPARPLPGREEQQKKPRKDLRFPKDVKMGR